MKTSLLYFLAAVAALLAPTAIVQAQGIQNASVNEPIRLPNPQSLVYSGQPVSQPSPFTLCSYENAAYMEACCAPPPNIQVFASLLYLQPGSGSLEYGTLVSPLPAPSPHWENQAIKPNFSPGFNIGIGYFVPETGNDIRTSWTHLDTSDSASFVGSPLQFAGPSFLIGPGATAYNIGHGDVSFRFNAVNLEAGHLWGANRPFQLRVHGGVQYASITQMLTGSFSDFGGTMTEYNTTDSKFKGAGPRVGLNAQFNRRNFQFLGDMSLMALIGSQHSRIDFSTTSALFPGGNPQSFTSPNATQVVPGLDSKLGGAYSFPLARGVFKVEAGYQVVAYLNAINSYTLTQVATPPVVGGVGVFFATAEHLQNTFTAHGPYMSGSWTF
jgi:hypothetical protein